MKINQPLTPNSKAHLLQKINSLREQADLLDHLVDAAVRGMVFPEPINDKLSGLQDSLKKSKDNQLVADVIGQAIQVYFKSEGLSSFQDCLEKAPEDVSWKSGLLRFLAKKLTVQVPQQYLLEVQVDQGKAHWRVINKKGVAVYDRAQIQGREFTFDPKQSWRLTIEEFLAFKNSGKRANNVVITEDTFIQDYGDEFKDEGRRLYQELRRLGVINAKCKVSMGFRLLSNDLLIPLQTHVKKKEIQGSVVEQLYAILEYQGLAEEITVNGEVLFTKMRSERTRKKAQGTGRVVNDERENSYYSTRIWDVGVYKDLSAYYTAEDVDQPLENDHVPSSAMIRHDAQLHLENLFTEQAELKKHHEVLQKALDKKVRKYHNEHNPNKNLTKNRRTAIEMHFVDEVQQVDGAHQQWQAKNKEIAQVNREKSAKLGDYWWTVAIPKALHCQGLTYQLLKAEQLALVKNPLHDEIECYLDILEKRPEDVGLTHADFIKALGAFRTLFHFQLKYSSIVDGKTMSGTMGRQMFHARKGLIQKVDTLFNTRMRQFLFAREDIRYSKSQEPVAKRALFMKG